LPRLSPEDQLVKIQDYFSFIGQISEPQIVVQAKQIFTFQGQAHKMLDFLKRFKAHVYNQSGEFEQILWNESQMA